METKRSIAAEIFKGMIGSLGELGLEEVRMYAETGLSSSLLESADGRVPFDRVIEFGVWVRDQRGPAAGIRVAESMAASQHFLLGYVLANCATLGEVFECWVRYRRIAFEGAPFEIEYRGDEVELGARYPSAAASQLPGLIEGYLAYTLAKGRYVTDEHWNPSLVLLQGAATDPHLYESFFGAPVKNGADITAIIFPSKLLDLPVRKSDPKLRAYLESVAESVLKELPKEESFVDDVRMHVMNALRSGQPTLEAIAEELHMSSRTLQRRLEREGASFGSVLDDVRRSAALAYLRDRHVAISEAAYLLGFSEPSTFYRAFKRWTGSTPADYRRSVSA